MLDIIIQTHQSIPHIIESFQRYHTFRLFLHLWLCFFGKTIQSEKGYHNSKTEIQIQKQQQFLIRLYNKYVLWN